MMLKPLSFHCRFQGINILGYVGYFLLVSYLQSLFRAWFTNKNKQINNRQTTKLLSPGHLVQIHIPLSEFILNFQNDPGSGLISTYLCHTISDPNLSQTMMGGLESDSSPNEFSDWKHLFRRPHSHKVVLCKVSTSFSSHINEIA